MNGSSSQRGFMCADSIWQALLRHANEQHIGVDQLLNQVLHNYLRDNAPHTLAPPQAAPVQQPWAPAQDRGHGYHQGGMPQQPHAQHPQPHAHGMPSLGPPASAHGMPSLGPPVSNEPMPSLGAPAHASAAPKRTAPPAPPAPPTFRRPPSIYEEVNAPPARPAQPIVLASLEENRQRASYTPPNEDVRMPSSHGYMSDSRMGISAVPSQNFMSQANTAPAMPTLYLHFNNQIYTIDKDKYIIGRSSQLADLAIRDGNISRKHCAIIYRNGSHYIKDLGSTNGIEYKGSRIDSKKIEDGDTFNVCEYIFKFTYRAR